jgi:uncharacterized protein
MALIVSRGTLPELAELNTIDANRFIKDRLKMTIDEIKLVLLNSKDDLATQYHVKSIGLFGSYVHGEQCQRSDLDVLVDFTKPVGLFDLIRLEDHLSSIVGIKVDLVMKKALKRRIGENILQDVIYI